MTKTREISCWLTFVAQVETISSSVQVEAVCIQRRKLKQVKVAVEQEEMTGNQRTIRSTIVVDNVQEVLTRSKRRESSVERSAVCRCVSAVKKNGWTNQELGHEISCSVGTLQREHLFHDNMPFVVLTCDWIIISSYKTRHV